MAHLRSNFTFRVPHSSFAGLNLTKELAVSALFVKGIHTRSNGAKGHFHVQITASGVGELGMNSEAELFKKIPNIDELDQFRDLNDKWIVVTLRGIGEMIGDKTSSDPQNRITLGEADGNGLFRGTGTVPATANMFHLLANELASLRRRRLTFSGIPEGAAQLFSLGHSIAPRFDCLPLHHYKPKW